VAIAAAKVAVAAVAAVAAVTAAASGVDSQALTLGHG